MEYRDAVIKAADTIRKDGSLSVIDVADALVDAYNAGRAEPLHLSPDERIVSAQAWEAFQCWQNRTTAQAEEWQQFMTWRGALNTWKAVDVKLLEQYQADNRRMDYVRENVVCTRNEFTVFALPVAEPSESLNEWLDRTIKLEEEVQDL